jgi:hypothetical protein
MSTESKSTGSSDPLDRNDIQIDFVTRTSQKKMKPEERCDLIIERIREGRILVLEGGLEPTDEALLVERTMLAIDHEKFMGIEICTPELSGIKSGFMKKAEPRITIVAPSTMEMTVRTI